MKTGSISGAESVFPGDQRRKVERDLYRGRKRPVGPRSNRRVCLACQRGECRGQGEGGAADTAAAGQGGRGVAGDTHRGIAWEGARACARRQAMAEITETMLMKISARTTLSAARSLEPWITSLKGMLPQLGELDVSGNRIMTPVSALGASLERLDASKNSVREIPGFSSIRIDDASAARGKQHI